MGLFDTIKSALGGSDDAEDDETARQDTAEEADTDSASEQPAAAETDDATDTDDEPSETASDDQPAERADPGDDEQSTGDQSEAERTDVDDGGFEWAGESDEIAVGDDGSQHGAESVDDEPAGEEAIADHTGGESATGDEEVATDRTAADASTADDESGFDHLTTEAVHDGPDMAEEAADFITEAEAGDDDADEGADAVEAIPEDDPRAEFVEQAEDLVDFWGEYDLEYSLASLGNLDELVGEQWDPERFEDASFGGDDYDSQVLTDTVTQLGSYFGEVLVRQQDGTWQQETGVGWTVNVPAGPDSEAAGATVTVFQVAEDCLTGPSTFTGMHDALADRLNLQGRAGDGDTPVDLDRADIETVATDDDVDDAAERLQAGAEDLADRWPSYDLDFSVDSLERLETLLDEQVDRERFAGVELGDETDQDSMLLTAHVVGVAGYLAEVLRRQRDASWDGGGRMVLVVEHGDSQTRIDPIEVAVASVRSGGSLVSAVPDA